MQKIRQFWLIKPPTTPNFEQTISKLIDWLRVADLILITQLIFYAPETLIPLIDTITSSCLKLHSAAKPLLPVLLFPISVSTTISVSSTGMSGKSIVVIAEVKAAISSDAFILFLTSSLSCCVNFIVARMSVCASNGSANSMSSGVCAGKGTSCVVHTHVYQMVMHIFQ